MTTRLSRSAREALALVGALSAAAWSGCAAADSVPGPGEGAAAAPLAAGDPAALAAPLAAGDTAGLAATLAAPSTETTLLLSAAWGDGPGAFGVDLSDEGARPGPMAFTFDAAGRLVVLDTMNERLQRFDVAHGGGALIDAAHGGGTPIDVAHGGGALIDVVALPPGLGEDVAAAPDGGVFVLEFRTGDGAGGELYDVVRVSADGKVTASYDVWVPQPTGLFVAGNDVLVESRHGPLFRVARLDGHPVTAAEQADPVAAGRPDRSAPGRTWEARKDGDTVRFVAHDAAGAPAGKFALAAPGALLSLFALDTDAAGDVFAGLYVDDRAVVAVAAPDGTLRGAAAVDPVRWSDARRFLAVRSDGALVEMQTSPDGVKFVEVLWRSR
ncbi:MAG TPA: hypothetical protein VG389_12705 [Myxococcota bacterium]|nr:hypothetical protein [Myxococcota bacterium]